MSLYLRGLQRSLFAFFQFYVGGLWRVSLYSRNGLHGLPHVGAGSFLGLLIYLSLLPLVFPSVQGGRARLHYLFRVPRTSVYFSSLPCPRVFQVATRNVFLSPVEGCVFGVDIYIF